MSLVCLLYEEAQVDPCLIGIGLAVPIFHVGCVHPAAHEEGNHIHEELLVSVRHFGNDGNFLTIGASFE
jgi:hypothetical protein